MKKLLFVSAAASAIIASSTPSPAFFDKTDRTEIVTVLPNESAFWVPDTGDNLNSQAKLESEAYYTAHKIATKRFQVPHVKISGSAGYSWSAGWDYFGPTGRLILVDRAPQSREWVKSELRGTSKTPEDFPCQSQEGINIGVGVSVGVEVHEEDASKFLYHFGVKPPFVVDENGRQVTDQEDGRMVFASVYYGRSLAEVTDTNVRRKIQTLMCDALAAKPFDEDNKQQIQIIKQVETDARAYLSDYGITLDFLGYADTWQFDPEIQHTINQNYSARTLAPQMPALQALNNLTVQEGLAKGLETHGLPIVIPSNLLDEVVKLAAGLPGRFQGVNPTEDAP